MKHRILLFVTIIAVLSIGRWTIPTPTIAATTTAPTSSSWTMTIIGDIMLDRNVRAKLQQYGGAYPFKKITAQLQGADVVLANLEGPFTNSTHHAVTGGSLLFTFEPKYVPFLKQAGFNTLLLANNHTLNQGQAGLANTRAVLQSNGLSYYGDPKNRTGYTLTKTLGGKKVTYIGYDGLDGTITNVLSEVRAAHRRGDYVIVTPHWGIEYKLGIQPALKAQAHQLIDAGADLIIGGHPHVVEPVEVYKGKFIAYSLGNFVFDQYFSTDTQRELMLKLSFTSTQLTVTFVPLVSVNSQPQVANASERQKLLNRISAGAPNSAGIKQQIRTGYLTIPINW